MKRKLVIGMVATVALVGVCLVALLTLSTWWVDVSHGIETSPEEFTDSWALWKDRSFSRYRMIASYTGIDPGIGLECRQEIEIYQDRVVEVIQNDCNETWLMTVDSIFALFQSFVGSGSSRVEASNRCSYYIVDAKYNHELGYPIFIENRLIGTKERYRYIYLETEFACLAVGPPLYTIEIESLIPLE